MRATARNRIQPDRVVWVVVGDRARIEDRLRDAGFGEVRVINPDGEVVGGGM